MPALLTLLVFGISAWIFVSLVRRLRRGDLSSRWWGAFAALCVLGALLGWRFLSIEYHLSPELRIVGVPMAVALFQREDGNWTDFIPDLQLFMAAADVTFGIALCLLPLRLAAWRFGRRSIAQEESLNLASDEASSGED